MKVSNAKSFLMFLTEEQALALLVVLLYTDPKDMELRENRPPVAQMLQNVYIQLATLDNGKLLGEIHSMPKKGKIYING